LIGKNIDLNLLSLFPQKGARIIGEIKSYQAYRGQQSRRKLDRIDGEPLGRRPP
jgi:hypothetical protein